MKGIHQLMGKSGYKAHRIRDNYRSITADIQPPHHRVECRKQLIHNKAACATERIKQSCFACIGVTDNRNGGDRDTISLIPSQGSLQSNFF